MANPVTQIIISAIDRTKAAFSNVRDGLKGVKREADDAGRGVEVSFGRLNGLLSRLGLGLGAAFSLRGIGSLADEFNNLQARLKLASRDTDEYNQANKDLERIAAAAKVPLSETAQLYTRIAASVKDLNVSQSQIADTTEAVALALKISGATAAESSSAMLQFSQAIASGVLRGEEFNAINESAPRLLQALAASLNVPVGALRDMAKEGQLTRDVLINGLLKALPQLQQEAQTLPDTIGSAFTNLKNQILLTVGEFDKATGASKGFAETLSGIGTTGIQALAVVGANVAFVFKGIGREIGGIAAQLAALARGDFKGFKFIGAELKKDAAEARRALDEFEKKILDGDKKVNVARKQNSADTTNALNNDAKAAAKAFKDSVDEQIGDAKRLQTALQGAFSEARKSEQDYRNEAKKLRDKASSSVNEKSQESLRLDATLEAMKLERIKSSGSAEEIRTQADAVRELASSLEDAKYARWLNQRADLAAAAAADKAADAEAERARGLAEQMTANEGRMERARQAAEELAKPIALDMSVSPQMDASLEKLREVKQLIDSINSTPVSVNATPTGRGEGVDALARAALQYGRRP